MSTDPLVGFRMYQPDGTLALEVPPQYGDPDGYLVARYGESEVLAIRLADNNWVFLDSQSGNIVDILTGRLAIYAIAAPDTSLRLFFPTVSNGDDPSLSYMIRDAQNNTLGEISGENPQLAPFGTAIVQQPYQQLITWRSPDDITTVDLLANYIRFETARPQIEIMETDTPLITTLSCEGSTLDMRLLGEFNGYVLGDTPNNVREEPNTSAAITGQIAAGDWFNIGDGPICSDSIAWWEVRTPDVTGWMAEGVDGEYFIQPGCPEVGCGRG